MLGFHGAAIIYLANLALAQSPRDSLLPAHDSRDSTSPYLYPSPNATGLGGWEVAIKRAKDFISLLTVDEKVGLCTGNGFPPAAGSDYHQCQGQTYPIPRLNFSGICYTDSDTGLGNTHSFATGFPGGLTASSTWNRELIRARGFAIATEFKAKGVHAVLGPVLALARTVGGGTNFEGFGADPYLIGVAGYETVVGQQAAGVQSEAKQYVGYDGQQVNRSTYSSNFDDKTLHEVEIWPYAEAVRAGVACIMTCYPYVNNSQPSQDAHLLNDILKTHLGFQGYTQTDWFGLKSGVAAILAGMDQNMPGTIGLDANASYFGANYSRAVQNGSVPEWRLDDAAIRIMTPYFYLGQDRNYPKVNLLDDPRLSIVDAQRQRHRTLAREIASAGTVLLKNTEGSFPKKKGLPLWKPTTITLFGEAAGPNPYGPNQYVLGEEVLPRFAHYSNDEYSIGLTQGTLAGGGGSGSTFYPHLLDPLSAIQQRAQEDLTLVDWSLADNLTFAGVIARRGTVCIPVVSSFAGEGIDRNLTLNHNGGNLILEVARNCDNTIVVVQSVGPVDMEKWVEHPNVTAIVWANLAGEELGPALVDILYGKVNPSGRLVYTIARDRSDYAQPNIVTTPQPHPQINYTEGISVDYRGFEKNNMTPRYWFGHGLSYSTFSYSNLRIDKTATLEKSLELSIEYVADAPGGDAKLYDIAFLVTVDIMNEGPFDGTEIPQLYLLMPPEAGNPTKVLRGFDNVALRDGDMRTAWFYLTRKDISYWSVEKQTWVTPRGKFEVKVGASAGDVRLSGKFVL